MTAHSTPTWRHPLVLSPLVAIGLLAISLVILAGASFVNPAPRLKAAFASGTLLADEAAHRAWEKLGRFRPDCEIAGTLVLKDQKFDRYLFAPQVPKDADGVLGTCQVVRDLSYGSAPQNVGSRPLGDNPVLLRATSRLALVIAPMQAWLIVQPLVVLLIWAGTVFLLHRHRQMTPAAVALMTAASLVAAGFAALTLTLGLAAWLWPLSVAAALLTPRRVAWVLPAISAALGALSALMAHESALTLSVLLSLTFGLSVRGLKWRELGENALAFVIAACVVTLLLAFANVLNRHLGGVAALQYVVAQFTDGAVFLTQNADAVIARSVDRVGKRLADYNGWLGFGLYLMLVAILFGGWATLLRSYRVTGMLVLLSLAVLVLWFELMLDRVSAQPMQFVSLLLLLFVYSLAALIAACLPRRATPLEVVT
ncbi:MAG: hypothetical protein QM647_02595 [Asticcacaulis sp.]|uniref:hypothetical protein n=1 Tax=Asticcacaulis sp. TaxID=1872648 RepID=UPI0039E64C33